MLVKKGDCTDMMFRVQPLRVTHSIPDCCGLILRSEHGSIVHTGDWKIEEDPVDGQKFDRTVFEDIGGQLPTVCPVSRRWMLFNCKHCIYTGLVALFTRPLRDHDCLRGRASGCQ